MMKRLMPILTAFLFLSSCGKAPSTIKVHEEIFPTTYSNEPILLKKQSLNCRENILLSGNTNFSLHLFMRGFRTSETRDFSPLLQGIFLKNTSVISRSVYGEKVEVLFSAEGTRHRILTEAKNIQICPEASGYLRETIESAALNTSYFINKTHLRFSTLFPEVEINPIVLNITPEILRSTLTKNYAGETIKNTSYMTDNAFYMPSNASVTFLPHSRDTKTYGLDLNYWEVPMVASHEYGHHLFQMIYRPQSLRTPHLHDCFGTSKKPARSSEKSFNSRTVTIDDVINSYNEGFADLISWYTLDSRERDVRGVKCLDISRDIGSTRFYNGKPKIFGQEALHSFFSFYPDSTNGTCEDHSYQDTHVLGAIFAHNADRFLSQFTDSDDEKLSAVVEWVKYLKAHRKKYFLASPKTYFEETFSGFIRLSLEKFNQSFDQKICSSIESIYPDLDMKECDVKKDL